MSPCALALVLLLDASASVPPPAWDTLQEGHAAAFEAPEVRRAIRAAGPVAVRAYEFSDIARPLTPWRVLSRDADAYAYARELRGAERSLRGGTATGEAVFVALDALARAPCAQGEGIIDVATDGPANMGRGAAEARGAAAAAGVRVNVLAIETSEGDPEPFARELATADGFVLRVRGWRDVPRSVGRKISLELAGSGP
jgi:hypothetical protein